MLQKKSALITGGAAGIGFAIACSLCDRGYSLTICDVDSTQLVKAKNDLEKRQPNAMVCTDLCDVTNPIDFAVAVEHHLSNHDRRLDVLVNNAGIAERGEFLQTDESSNWRDVVEVDFAAVVEGTRLGISAMHSTGGIIINIASAGGLFPMPFSPIYAAAKAAVIMFSRSLDIVKTKASRQIVVRAFCPQFVDTAFVRSAMEEVSRVHARSSARAPIVDDGRISNTPTAAELITATGGRLLSPTEAADACVCELIDKPAELHKSSALLLTTRGKKWWRFEGDARSHKEVIAKL